MGSDAEQLRREIEQTRRELTYDADALTEKVSPGRIVDRRVGRAKNALTNAKEKVMGTASDTTYSAQSGLSSAQSSVSSAVSGVAGTTSDLAGTAKQRAQGNPLAAGLIAFGAGWLVSALIPASEREQRAAGQLMDTAKEKSQPLTENLGQIASEIKDNLTEPAQQAVQSVSDTASDAAQTLKYEGQAAAQDVKSDAQQATQNVKQGASSSNDPDPLGSRTGY